MRVPREGALEARARGDKMDFDPELAVRLVWAGLPIRHVQTPVRDLDGGISHDRLWKVTALLSWMQTRLEVGAFVRLLGWRPRRLPA